MGAGKVFAIIGGVLGVLSVLLYYIMPEIFSLWRVDIGSPLKTFLGGFGAISGENVPLGVFGIKYSEDIIFMIVSMLIFGGSVLIFIAGLTPSKAVGILGGIILLAGPTLLLFEIIAKIGAFEDIAFMMGEVNLLFGSVPGVGDWGIGISFFLAIGGGILGIIGGATV